MSFVEQRKFLVDNGFYGYHLGYTPNYYIPHDGHDPVLVYKKSPYVPILSLPAQEFYSIPNEELLKVIRKKVQLAYVQFVADAQIELDDALTARDKVRVEVSFIKDRGERYKVQVAMSSTISRLRKKLAKVKQDMASLP
jgi:hypothetical protein